MHRWPWSEWPRLLTMVSISAQRRSKNVEPSSCRTGPSIGDFRWSSDDARGRSGGNGARGRGGDMDAGPPPPLLQVVDDSGEYGRKADSAADDRRRGVPDRVAGARLNRKDASIFRPSPLSIAANLDQSSARGDRPQFSARCIFSGFGFSHV